MSLRPKCVLLDIKHRGRLSEYQRAKGNVFNNVLDMFPMNKLNKLGRTKKKI